MGAHQGSCCLKPTDPANMKFKIKFKKFFEKTLRADQDYFFSLCTRTGKSSDSFFSNVRASTS
jgi:hypothetical protein